MLSILKCTGWSFPRRTMLSQCPQFLWRNTRGLGAWLSCSHSWLLFHHPLWACTLPLTHFALLKNVCVTGLERERQGLNPKSRGAQQRGHQPGRARVGDPVSLGLLLLLCRRAEGAVGVSWARNVPGIIAVTFLVSSSVLTEHPFHTQGPPSPLDPSLLPKYPDPPAGDLVGGKSSVQTLWRAAREKPV